MRKTLRIHRDVSLDSRNLLARVVTLFSRAGRVLHALRINDQETRLGAAPLSGAGRSNLIFLKRAHTRLIWLAPFGKVRMHGPSFRKILRQHPPLATAFREVQHRAERFVQIHCAWLGSLAHALQHRADLLERLFADIAWVTFSHLKIQ
jgi:hypothetical protein